MVDEAVAGCFKLYRRAAFDRIGGFVRALMWDGIDFHRARQAGFATRSIEDEQLRIIHLHNTPMLNIERRWREDGVTEKMMDLVLAYAMVGVEVFDRASRGDGLVHIHTAL